MNLREIVGGGEGVDWMHLTHDRDQWRDVVNTVMNIRFPKIWVISRINERLLASQEGLCSIKLVGKW
jgi:hypothetical protein